MRDRKRAKGYSSMRIKTPTLDSRYPLPDPMTYDDVVQIALAMPDVEEGLSWGSPGVKRKGRFMFRLKEDGETIAVKLDWDTRNRLLKKRPDVFFLTPHYEGYPALLARLAALTEDLAKPLVEASWADAPRPAKTRGSTG